MKRIVQVFLWIFIISTISCAFDETSDETSPGPSGNAPAAPTELTTSVGEKQVAVQWKAVVGASSYNLYWSGTRGVTPATGTKIADVKSPYVHTGLTDGETYSYIVTAVNNIGESGRSDEATITLNSAPPAATVGS
jgi:hypothetical protein